MKPNTVQYGAKKSSRNDASNARLVIGDLERALISGPPDKCATIMRSVTDLFLTVPTQLTDDQVALFDDVINKLIGHLESRALSELSERLAPYPNTPPQAIRRLAFDDSIAVAGPVLAQSSNLTDEHLVQIAETKSQQHLNKIASRRQLSPMSPTFWLIAATKR